MHFEYDDKTNERKTWYSGDNHHLGEAVFAPNPSGTSEDDGWMVVTDHDHVEGTSDVCILDAQNIEAGPIGRVHMPRRMPFGFHTNWLPEES